MEQENVILNPIINPPPKRSAFSTALKYAIITGLASFIFSLITYSTGLYLNQAVNWLVYIILLAGLIFTVKDRRDKDLGGYMTFGEGFGAGFLFCVLFGVLSIIFSLIMMNFIAPDMISEIMKQTEQKMIDKGMSDDQIQLAMSYTKKFMTPAWMALWIMVGIGIFGCILSLIVAAVFKKDNPQLQPPL